MQVDNVNIPCHLPCKLTRQTDRPPKTDAELSKTKTATRSNDQFEKGWLSRSLGGTHGEHIRTTNDAEGGITHRSFHHAALLHSLHRPGQYRLCRAHDEQGPRFLAGSFWFWRWHFFSGVIFSSKYPRTSSSTR